MSDKNILIKDLWDELAVNDEYKQSFKNFKKYHKLKSEKKFYQDYEKQHLIIFKAFLKVLNKQLKIHSTQIKKLKKYDENIDLIFDDNNDEFLFNFINEIIECIKIIRENSYNIMNLFIQIKGNDKKHNLEKIDKKYFNSQKIYKIFDEVEYFKNMKILNYFDINPDFILSDKQSENDDKIKIPMKNIEIEKYDKLVPLFYECANDLYNKEHPLKNKNEKKKNLNLQQKLLNLKDELGEEEYNKLFFIHYIPPQGLFTIFKLREKMNNLNENNSQNFEFSENSEEENEEEEEEIQEMKKENKENNENENNSEYLALNKILDEEDEEKRKEKLKMIIEKLKKKDEEENENDF